MNQILTTHRVLQFKDYLAKDESCSLIERSTSLPTEGQVLVKMSFAPINPSDLMFIRGLYGIKKKLPFIGGFEGSGIIVATGSSRFQVGDRVAVVAGLSDGTWAEYMLTSEDSCILLEPDLSLEQGAMLFVNPLTCYAMFHKATETKTNAIVQTAGASALGKMLNHLTKKKELPVINVVRKEKQEEVLKELGAEYILNSEKESFQKEFYKLTKKLNASFLIDAVGGELTTKLIPLLPLNSTILIYGNLSEKDFSVSPGILIFQNKKIEGFWLSTWIRCLEIEKFQSIAREVQNLYPECFSSQVNKIFPLETGYQALEFYKKNMTEGKILFSMEKNS